MGDKRTSNGSRSVSSLHGSVLQSYRSLENIDIDELSGEQGVDYEIKLESYNDVELNQKFEGMLVNMNLTEEKKNPLRMYDSAQKIAMLLAYRRANTPMDMNLIVEKNNSLRIYDRAQKLVMSLGNKGDNSQKRRSRYEKPSDYIYYLNQPDLPVNKLIDHLRNLRISLTNNTLEWIEEFGEVGIQKLVIRLKESQQREDRYIIVETECIKCLNAIMNNTVGIKLVFACFDVLPALAKSLKIRRQCAMIEAVKVLAATSLIPGGFDKVIDAITMAGETSRKSRFSPIVDGLKSTVEPLKIACMQLINAIISGPDDLDFRMHLRNEFMRSDLNDVLVDLKCIEDYSMKIQIEAFEGCSEDDHEEFLQRFDNAKMDINDINDCFELVKNMTNKTAAEPNLLSILQHFLFIKDDHFIRPAYYKLIEECVTQIVLHKNGCDPDFRATTKFKIDVQPLIDGLVEKSKVEDQRKYDDLHKKLDEALAAKQEAEAKIAHLCTFISGVPLSPPPSPMSSVPIHSTPPPMPGETIPPSSQIIGSDPVIPPPPPIFGGPCAPPPPPLFGGPGVPPPPPMIGGASAPPPPPIFGGPGAPPPMGMVVAPIPCSDVLPYGLKPKRNWEVDGGISLKRANWKSIVPEKMTQNSFWISVQEDQHASPDIFTGLTLKFSTKPSVKKPEDLVDGYRMLKKVKHLKVLDGKSAQNISILLGGALKHLSYDSVRKCIMRCDTNVLTTTVLDLLIQYLPSPDQLKRLSELKGSYNDLVEAEQFAVTVSDIKRLLPRLKSLSFKQHYKELLVEIKPDIVSGTAACEEIKSSTKFAKILELVLLLGNYMNTGSKNAGAFGFEMSFLTKLTSTKDLENKQTLLHYLVDTIQSKYRDVLTFNEEISHVDRASRVSMKYVEKSIKKIDSGIKNLEIDLENSKIPQDADDQFYPVMSNFSSEARNQCDILQSMFKKMEVSYADLAEYYAFDQAKYPIEEFFNDVKIFKNSFLSAHAENLAIKEAEEKSNRARESRLQANKKKMERTENKKQIFNIDTQQAGVMDNLMEALSTGKAFNRDRQQKKRHRVSAEIHGQMRNRSRSISRPSQSLICMST